MLRIRKNQSYIIHVYNSTNFVIFYVRLPIIPYVTDTLIFSKKRKKNNGGKCRTMPSVHELIHKDYNYTLPLILWLRYSHFGLYLTL
jgi:hypothetical protein